MGRGLWAVLFVRFFSCLGSFLFGVWVVLSSRGYRMIEECKLQDLTLQTIVDKAFEKIDIMSVICQKNGIKSVA